MPSEPLPGSGISPAGGMFAEPTHAVRAVQSHDTEEAGPDPSAPSPPAPGTSPTRPARSSGCRASKPVRRRSTSGSSRPRGWGSPTGCSHTTRPGREDRNSTPVRERQRLLQVMGDEQHRRAPAAPQRVQPASQAPRQRLVEGGEGLVHQQQSRIHPERPRERHPALHAAREPAGVRILEPLQPDLFEDRPRRLDAVGPLRQDEAHVLQRGEPWHQARGLEHVADPPIPCLVPTRIACHLPLEIPVEPGHDVQEGGLARPGRADDRDELPRLDGELQPFERQGGRMLEGLALDPDPESAARRRLRVGSRFFHPDDDVSRRARSYRHEAGERPAGTLRPRPIPASSRPRRAARPERGSARAARSPRDRRPPTTAPAHGPPALPVTIPRSPPCG